jgi:hypothetical protein
MANNKYNEKYTRELLAEAAANSISIAGVLRYLEIPRLEAPMPISAASSSSEASTPRISRARLTCGAGLPPTDSLPSRFW